MISCPHEIDGPGLFSLLISLFDLKSMDLIQKNIAKKDQQVFSSGDEAGLPES